MNDPISAPQGNHAASRLERRRQTLIGYLRERPHTMKELAARLGVSAKTGYEALDGLRSGPQRCVYCCDWQRNTGIGGAGAPVFALGNLPDVPRPQARPEDEVARQSRERVRNRRKEQLREEEALISSAAAAQRDVLVRALFGDRPPAAPAVQRADPS